MGRYYLMDATACDPCQSTERGQWMGKMASGLVFLFNLAETYADKTTKDL
jgi:N-acetylmuramic acid 6-phosphate (MurNAc-6-P) etherase